MKANKNPHTSPTSQEKPSKIMDMVTSVRKYFWRTRGDIDEEVAKDKQSGEKPYTIEDWHEEYNPALRKK